MADRDGKGSEVEAPGPLDVVVPRAPTEDGKGVQVVRVKDASVEVGEVRPLEDGRPIQGDVVKLTPRTDVPAWNVEVLVRRPDAAVLPAPVRDRAGPPQVATSEYRRNWKVIFGDEDEAN